MIDDFGYNRIRNRNVFKTHGWKEVQRRKDSRNAKTSPYQILTKHTSVVHKTIAFLSTNYTINDDTDHSLLFCEMFVHLSNIYLKKGEKNWLMPFFKSLILIPVKASERINKADRSFKI